MKKRIVLTGGASCGKSTTINALKQKGFPVLEEIAREVIERRGSFPTEKSEIKALQEEMFEMQIKGEDLLNGKLSFLDRGVGDYIAYSRHLLGYVHEMVAKFDFKERYKQVFALDRLPFIDDGLRIESGDEEASKIHKDIINAYAVNGYNVVHVPVMSVDDRIEFILNNVDEN
ncbi:ATP-binding protein [Candidatus Pacearchaeota archaeon]|nr:ATP-binding protein [Candidatus Pacearchaeota archaeon]